MATIKKPVNEYDYELLYELKKHGINKDDALGFLLLEKEEKICKELLKWCRQHEKFTTEDLLDYIFSELVEPKKMFLVDD